MKKRIPSILDIAVLCIFLFLIVFTGLSTRIEAGILYVETDDSEYRFTLSEDGIYSVQGAIGETTIEIRNGKARFLNSPCPNKTCVQEGFGRMLVCLPNRVIASMLEAGGEIDAIAR